MDWTRKKKINITDNIRQHYVIFMFCVSFSVKLLILNLPPRQCEHVDKHKCAVCLSMQLSRGNHAHERGVYHAYATGVYNLHTPAIA